MEGNPSEAPESVGADSATEVVSGATAGDIQVMTRPDDPAGAPEARQSDPSQAEPPEDDGDEGAAEVAAAAEADEQAHLEQYPESVRDAIKDMPQEHRKVLHEHFGQRDREARDKALAELQAERERTERIEAANQAAEAERQKILASHGKFVGKTPIDLRDADGNIVPGPTYDELVSSLQTRRGREQLWEKYSLTDDTAEAIKAELDQRQDMLTSSSKWQADQAWNTLAAKMQTGLEAINGVDADAVIARAAEVASTGGNGPAEVLTQVVSSLEERHAREMAAQKRDYEGRITGLTKNDEALRGRVVAAESRRLPTGGRTGGGTNESEIERLQRENPEEYIERAKRGDFAGVDRTR